MPATLGHLGAQALITRALIRGADIKWVWLGCLIPDLPWILQRVVRSFDVSPYDLRLYAVVQSSLLFCLLLSGCAAFFSKASGRVFVILAMGAVLHLTLDAMQSKWANGVLLFAPFEWDVLNFGWFWPEAWPSLALYALGVGYAVYAVLRLPVSGADLRWPRRANLVGVALFALAYVVGPVVWMPHARAADVHYAKTLEERPERVGKPLELDRTRVWQNDPVQIITWSGERLVISNLMEVASGTISLKGEFSATNTIEVTQIQEHRGQQRDYASYLGLLIILGWWLRCLIAARSRL